MGGGMGGGDMLRRVHSDGVLHSATHSNNLQMGANAQLLLSLSHPHPPAFPTYTGGGTGPSSSSANSGMATGSEGRLEGTTGAGGSLEGSAHEMFLPIDDDPFMVLGLGDVKGGLGELHVSSIHRRKDVIHTEENQGNLLGSEGMNLVHGMPIQGSLSGHNLGNVSSSLGGSISSQVIVVYDCDHLFHDYFSHVHQSVNRK